ncbi:hypothetical protein KGF57_003241 [Candida theae]|uniref:Uncharacterized protein n=1 Tax=Candida theae TaxID=1198502 RepID=A0AAD5FY24_9ASCO|nr:uncharacterized protein KGF57_003241 [Candida theae]KAI5957547.1 hypothetical protein KGF57_003241 [Candida theae]
MINDNIHNGRFGSAASSADADAGAGAGGEFMREDCVAVAGNFKSPSPRSQVQPLKRADNERVDIDDHLNSMSQFIYLEAAEAAGRSEDEEKGEERAEQQVGGEVNHGAQVNGGAASVASSLDIMSVQDKEDLNNEFNEFIDIPNLVSDNDSDEVVTVSTKSAGYWNQQRSLQPTPVSTANANESASSPRPVQQQQQQREQQEQQEQSPQSNRTIHQQVQLLKRQSQRAVGGADSQIKQNIINSLQPFVKTNIGISPEQFKHQRTQLMTIIVKYVATKIYNTFPPEAPKRKGSSSPSSPTTSSAQTLASSNELPLDKFLLLLTSRLRVSLSTFLKAIIYLFRYMDIIYLLRYLNQTNNFVNYNDMGFELKKLIVGCFKLTIIKENRVSAKKLQVNWQHVTGLSNQEINSIVRQLVNRMNGKLTIKDVEVVRMKNEMYRFVNLCL